VNAEQARALLAQGKKDGTFEAPIPEDDAKAISEAADLVEMAETAWSQMVRGPEVEVLLRMAAEAEGEDPPDPDQKPEPKQAPEDEPDPEPEPKEEKAEPTPESQPEEGGDDLSKIEPWEGYDGEKVSDIKAGINAAVREYEEADLTDLMSNVYAYEAAHKKRATILDHLEGVAAKLQSGEDLDPDPPDAGGDDDDTQADQGRSDDSDVVPEEPQLRGESDETPGEDAPEEAEAPGADEEGQSGADGDAGEDRSPEPGLEPEPDQPVHEADDGQVEEVEPKPKRAPRQKKEKDEPEEELDDYQRLIEQAQEDIKRERVHTPKPPQEEVPDLPWDWSAISDKELHRLHGIYSVVAYYKSSQVALDERIGLLCKAAADELHNALLVAMEKYDEAGKEKRVAVLEAEIENDENVVLWRRRQRKHETYSAHHRNERDSVGKIVEALSRQETMRHQAWERSKKS
jgi:hypothetical protein